MSDSGIGCFCITTVTIASIILTDAGKVVKNIARFVKFLALSNSRQFVILKILYKG